MLEVQEMVASARGKVSVLEMLLSLHHCQSVNPKVLQSVACMLEQPWLLLKYSPTSGGGALVFCGHLSCRYRRCLLWVCDQESVPRHLGFCSFFLPYLPILWQALSHTSGCCLLSNAESHRCIVHCHLSNL